MALLVGPVALANVIVPVDDSESGRVEASAAEESTSSLVHLQRQAPQFDLARVSGLQSIQTTTTTTAPPTTTTTAPPTTTTTAPPVTEPPVTEPPAPPETAPPSSGGGLGDPNDYASWDALAQCESGGNWAIDTGNGYYGGLQFSASSWAAVGGTGLPHEHPRETQILMGQRLQAAQGWDAWPSCTAELGFR